MFSQARLLLGGQYLVVFAGDDDDPATGSDLYTEFGLEQQVGSTLVSMMIMAI